MICDDTTWVPYFSPVATLCLQLRLLYFAHGIAGNAGLGGRNCATIYYRRFGGGNLCHVTNSSESGVGASRHSERVCYDELLAREGWTPVVAAGHVICVYSERFPCGPQNYNCYAFLDNWLNDDTPVFWSFEWPDANDSYKKNPKKRKKDDPDWDKARKKAKSGRAKGTKSLQWYQKDIDYKSSVPGTSVTSSGDVNSIISSVVQKLVSAY